MIIFVFHICSALLIVLGCCLVFLRKTMHKFWSYFLLGWTSQVILSLPAGIWQSLRSWPHISVSGSPLWIRLLTPLIGWPFNTGGYTVRWIFENTVERLEWLIGHRSATVLSNMPYYWFLLILQGSIFACMFALLYKGNRKITNPFVFAFGVFFLTNSLANVTWFWAGT